MDLVSLMPPMVNMECAPSSITSGDGIAQDFGFGFPLKGNFTFTWILAVKIVVVNNMLIILCS